MVNNILKYSTFSPFPCHISGIIHITGSLEEPPLPMNVWYTTAQ